MALGDDYVTASELKAELGITDTVDDTQLELAIDAASSWINAYCERDFNQASAATARVFQPLSPFVCYVDDIASTTNLAVKTDVSSLGTYTETWSTTDYELRPVNAIVNGQAHAYTSILSVQSRTFPYARRSPVQVTAIWGWPAVPKQVKKACMVQAARLYKRRFSPEGVLGGAEGMGPVRVGHKLDPDVCALLSAFRRDPSPVA